MNATYWGAFPTEQSARESATVGFHAPWFRGMEIVIRHDVGERSYHFWASTRNASDTDGHEEAQALTDPELARSVVDVLGVRQDCRAGRLADEVLAAPRAVAHSGPHDGPRRPLRGEEQREAAAWMASAAS